jgi:FdhE protein
VPPLHPDALWRLATSEWAEIEAKLPDLAPSVQLQQRLVRLVLDASTALDDTISLPLSADAASGKLLRGVPVMRNETVPIPRALEELVPPLCDALAESGAGDSARHIRQAIVDKELDAASLLSVSLARHQAAIRTSALHMGFAPDLLWLVGELASSPLAHRLQDRVVWSAPRTGTGVRPQEWDRGYCPFCGSWPVFIEVHDAARSSRCSYCALGWSLSSHRCVYCGNSGEDFLTAAADVHEPQRCVDLCGSCSGYTKVVEVAAPTPFPLLAIEDLASLALDRGAMDRGYRRPELMNLDAIEPRTSAC